ncbi:MAG: hypothetical protein EHM23_29160 [Acidobacteria bacterium]|nr:MAG: hypothetical protein EHM23_29160 [Acidobacteriota bacterium]
MRQFRVGPSCLIVLAVFWIGLFCSPADAKEKMKPEELVSRHLAALGSPEARAAAKTRVLDGPAEVTFRIGGTGRSDGKAVFLSEGRKVRLLLNFDHPEYPAEQLLYDGKRVSVGLIRPSIRSRLCQFIYDNEGFLTEGLMGGATLLGWSLLDREGRKARLDYRGLKDVEGKKLHELRYIPRSVLDDFQILLYFEPETFRHVLSVYRLRIPHFMAGKPADSGKMRESYWKMTEEFDDFKTVDGLTLPHAYRLVLNFEGEVGPFLAIWEAKFSRVMHNHQMAADVFGLQ